MSVVLLLLVLLLLLLIVLLELDDDDDAQFDLVYIAVMMNCLSPPRSPSSEPPTSLSSREHNSHTPPPFSRISSYMTFKSLFTTNILTSTYNDICGSRVFTEILLACLDTQFTQ